MPTLHLFNPSHDEALAARQLPFTPSRSLRVLGEALYDLPQWWMQEGDQLLRLPAEGKLSAADRPDWTRITHISPWGWNAALCQQLRALGAPEALLPTAAQLEQLKALSSRATCSRISAWIGQQLASAAQPLLSQQPTPSTTSPAAPAGGAQGDSSHAGGNFGTKPPSTTTEHGSTAALLLRPYSRFCTTMAEVEAALSVCQYRAMVKRPWSSSGRGVFPLSGSFSEAEQRRVSRCLREQGGVEIQRWETRLCDAAMEFHITSAGAVRYEGLALFLTQAGGAYGGNLAAAQPTLRALLWEQWQQAFAQWERARAQLSEAKKAQGESAPPLHPSDRPTLSRPFPCADFETFCALLRHTQALLTAALTHFIAPHYSGPVGIDLMLTPTGLHPCIELNLRRTMGHVALAYHQRCAQGRQPQKAAKALTAEEAKRPQNTASPRLTDEAARTQRPNAPAQPPAAAPQLLSLSPEGLCVRPYLP